MNLNDFLIGSAHIIVHFGLLRKVNADGVHSRLHMNDRRRCRKKNGVFEVFDFQRGGHDDEFQLRFHFAFRIELRTQRDNAREQSKKKIRIEVAFVSFIQ